VKDPPFRYFDDFQYNGRCHVIELTETDYSGISIDNVKSAFKNDREMGKVTRLLIKTYKSTPNEWDVAAAFLTMECAKFLATLPNLILVGIDTPSIDHQSASPIIKYSHGSLWESRIAILENLSFPKEISGDYIIQTRWTAVYRDSKQAIVTLYPIN
jgi:kynurenine formamidase